MNIIPPIFKPDVLPAYVHRTPCEHCPSANAIDHDPEVKDILTMPYKDRAMTVFACAWRPNKLCKGYCETIGFQGGLK